MKSRFERRNERDSGSMITSIYVSKLISVHQNRKTPWNSHTKQTCRKP